MGVPGRDWDQFLRFIQTFVQVDGSYLWASFLTDKDEVERMLAVPAEEWDKTHLPPLFGWSKIVDKLTDIGDQLIASRARDDKTKFYPRPDVPAIRLRRERHVTKRDDKIEAARKRNRERRGLNTT